MNAVTPLPQTGYGANAVRTARDAEYDVISRVTRLLRQSDRDGRSAEAIMAVHKNNELWTLLATDLAAPGNRLSDELKAGLLSLAAFSIRHGHRVLAGEVSTDALIEVNMSILKGLRGEVQ
ncbi:flagellar biosynthesis regulator FlaF [Paracoccus seriniphilus]|uniref:flagellar biosynthesis regulator FlaF n=1 Tax=Paracoccus seriniphilus TaxID=184748 RepID=UPI00356349F4